MNIIKKFIDAVKSDFEQSEKYFSFIMICFLPPYHFKPLKFTYNCDISINSFFLYLLIYNCIFQNKFCV